MVKIFFTSSYRYLGKWQGIQYLLPLDHRLVVFKSIINRVGLVIIERYCRMTRRRLSLPLYVSVLMSK